LQSEVLRLEKPRSESKFYGAIKAWNLL